MAGVVRKLGNGISQKYPARPPSRPCGIRRDQTAGARLSTGVLRNSVARSSSRYPAGSLAAFSFSARSDQRILLL